MCGRLSRDAELSDLAAQLQFNPAPGAVITPNRDVRPTDPILIIDRERAGRSVSWGLPNGYHPKRPLFNARAETVSQQPSFRQHFAAGRCLVVATGFYEWDQRKRRIHFRHAAGRPLTLAGICNGAAHPAAAIITTAPNSLMRPIHNRMPVLLDPDAAADWLNPNSPAGRLRELLLTREWDHIVAEPMPDPARPAPAGQALFAF